MQLSVFLLLVIAAARSQEAEKASCVSSVDELHDALDDASYGDVIKICDGDYTQFQIEIKTVGVTVEAVTHGKVKMHDDSHVVVRGSENTFAGVEYHGGGNQRPIEIRGDLNTVYDCVINHAYFNNWVTVKGVGNTVRNCRFSDKRAIPGGDQELLNFQVH